VTSNIDPEQVFMKEDVQNILRKITHFDVDQIFKEKPVPNLTSPRYVFMSDEEVEMCLDQANEKGRKLLEMPPFMNPWVDETQILSQDPEIQGFEESNLVFTDISPGFSDRNRMIAVREPNGTLRRAHWEERYRMNQIYFPVQERSQVMPRMFEEDNLEKTLSREDYLFVLERACLQLQPDDPQYLRIVHRTYDHIVETKKFDDLRSTRHFGPLSFYLTIKRNIDPLLLDMIQRELIEDGADLVKLHYLVNVPQQRGTLEGRAPLDVIETYTKECSQKRHFLELGLQAYRELLKERQLMDQERQNEAKN
jgi:small subunit ribosomal protein S22